MTTSYAPTPRRSPHPTILTQPTQPHSPKQQVIPGYGGGMSSAKAQLESDTRTLAYEAGRKYKVRACVCWSASVLDSVY